MIAIRGIHSSIAQALIRILPDSEKPVFEIRRRAEPPAGHADRFLFAAGYLLGKPWDGVNAEDVARTFEVNFGDIVEDCEDIFAVNDRARICIIGSESGEVGSYDMAYAGAKAAIHLYIRTRKLKPSQQLVGIAPWIIEDSGMTERRPDKDRLPALREGNPKKRFLTAFEVAMMVYHLLYVDQGYTTGCVIPMNGGRRA